MLQYCQTPIIQINTPELGDITLLIKREDLNHPYVTGNKWWKLKYNLSEAVQQRKDTLLTFGGAYSNHIYATAAAASELGLKSIGIIRGEETFPLNHTLRFAERSGMKLHYLSRNDYRQKSNHDFIQSLHDMFGDFYLIPEGGSNDNAIKGIREFAKHELTADFDYLCVPVGTGGTLAGHIEGIMSEKEIIGFSALKNGDFLHDEVQKFLKTGTSYPTERWRIETSYHHGGYGKVTKDLLLFLNNFHRLHGFQLDPVYTGKMLYGIIDMVKKGQFKKGSTILAVHTGGLQGWDGIQRRYSLS